MCHYEDEALSVLRVGYSDANYSSGFAQRNISWLHPLNDMKFWWEMFNYANAVAERR